MIFVDNIYVKLSASLLIKQLITELLFNSIFFLSNQ
jgi:hypothetical protein